MEEIRNYDSSGSGAYWGKLVSAYAEYVFAKSAYEREKSLSDQKITSENDFLSAVNNLKQAEANYLAALDESVFEVTRDLLEAQQQQQVGTLELKNAERTLYVLGLSESDIEGLDHLSTTTGEPETGHECNDPNCTDCSNHQNSNLEHSRASGSSHLEEHECNDANCTDCANHKEKDVHGRNHTLTGHDERTLALYPLRAPFDGTIVEKHITLGEKLGDDDNAFTIVDLSNVWVDFSIFAKELDSVHLGEQVRVSTANSNQETTGAIGYLAPVIDRETRTALGRATIENTDEKWRPGLFVTVDILTKEIPVPLAVPIDAVQNIEDEAVVFVRHEGDIEPRPVRIGREDSSMVEILAGLSPGDEYVSGNSFSLKAEIITSGLDPHAGHGH